METKISPFFTFIKKKYLHLMFSLPINLLEMFLGEFNSSEELKINLFRSGLEDDSWCKSRYTINLIAETNKLIPKFLERYDKKTGSVNFKSIEIAFKLYSQFLSYVELRALSKDMLTLFEEVLQVKADNFNDSRLSQKDKETFADLIAFFTPAPPKSKTLSTLMMELPFFIFIEISKADGEIDKKERLKFVDSIKERDWCKSRCSQFMLLSTEYGYEELFTKFKRNLLKFDFKQIVRTMHMMEDMFEPGEVALV